MDVAYKKEKNPKIAVEVLLGHGHATVIVESSVKFRHKDVLPIVERIANIHELKLIYVPQDIHLANNQAGKFRCGDNGIFKGMPVTREQRELALIAGSITSKYPYDGKYILDGEKLVICQSNAKTEDLRKMYPHAIINPLGEWTGGSDVDSGATNRKLGSDMGDSVTGGGLCLSGDTEFLSNDFKWHRIDEYKEGQLVGQWNNGELEFVFPTAYIHNPKGKLYHIYNDSKLSMCLTPDHEMLIETSKHNLIKKKAKDVVPNLINGVGNAGKIIHTFRYYENANPKLDFYHDTCLQVAFCADGTILDDSNKKWRGRIRVKKQYKKDRLRELLILRNKPFLETRDNEYSIFWFTPPMECKSLYECFKDYSVSTWDIVANEVFNWDGDSKRKLFRTTRKEDADFVQLLFATQGRCSTILYDEKKNYYTVHLLKSYKTSLRKTKTTPIKVDEFEGESYCFNVPSHNLIVRHNDRIFITGNCGKDLSKADVSVNIYAFLKAQETGKPVEISCAIGDEFIDGKPYGHIVAIAKEFIDSLGGFEKFAELGLIR